MIAEIDMLAGDRVDVAQQLLQVAGHHGLSKRMANLTIFDVERVLCDAAEVKIAVRNAAREAREDDAAPRAGDDVVEAPLAGRDDEVPAVCGSVTPIGMWLAAVRNLKAPKLQGLERHDQIVSIDVEGELALLKLKLQIPPRYFTDMLSCLKVNGTWKIVQKVMTSKT